MAEFSFNKLLQVRDNHFETRFVLEYLWVASYEVIDSWLGKSVSRYSHILNFLTRTIMFSKRGFLSHFGPLLG